MPKLITILLTSMLTLSNTAVTNLSAKDDSKAMQTIYKMTEQSIKGMTNIAGKIIK